MSNAAKAIDFYKKAFGAVEIMRMKGPDGKIVHGEIRIGDSAVMLSDEIPGMTGKTTEGYGGSPVSFYVYLENVDAAYKRAVDAGATAKYPVMEMFWGDRLGNVLDPFGHSWTLSQHVKDVTPEEMKKGQEEFMAKFAKK